MTEHTKTDGLPAAVPDAMAPGLRSPLRNERMASEKIECNACPVLCQISAGRTGACDRYANQDGVLVRLDPVVMLRRAVDSGDTPVVPFAPANPQGDESPQWDADLLHSQDVFVTGVGASTTYPDYKPAPFIVGSQLDGVDMVTVVTEGIFSYCSLKVKIDTDRHLGDERAAVLFGGAMAGLGGAYLSLVYTPMWTESMVAGRGWIALALVVFSAWKPLWLALGAVLFGFVTIAQFHAEAFGLDVSPHLLATLPYLATVLVLLLISRDATRLKLNSPAALGKPFNAST